MKNVLVVGGAGYIGSYMCKYLSKNGYQPVVLDNLVYGHQQAVKWGPLIEGSMEDAPLLHRLFDKYSIDAVMHFAAFAYVGESVANPAKYYRNNVVNTIALLDVMRSRGIKSFIFSSSCATYGEPETIPINEEHPQNPINPYGRAKLMVEQILEDYHKAYGLRSTSLRYFNAAGADPDSEVGEDHQPETHLIPLVLQTALGQREHIKIFGHDYSTPDGTCIRDYIHIHDLAQAHLRALEKLLGGDGGGIYNLGNGDGYSVKQVIKTSASVSGKKISSVNAERRPGDPAVLVGSSRKARTELGWNPEYPDLQSIIETAWRWHKTHPQGYKN